MARMKQIVIAFLVLSMMACGQSTKVEEAPKENLNKNWNTFTQANYSVSYPSVWELNQSGDMGTSFIIFSPKESEQDNFRENVNLLIQDLTGKNIDLDKYTQISEGQIKTLAVNSTIVESKDLASGEMKYHKMVYTSDQGSFHLKYEQYYWVLSEIAYVLTFTTEQSTFNTFKETGEKIMNSFKFQNSKK